VVRKLLTGSLIAALMAGTAGADTLREALVSAYQTNPTLTAQRQTLEVTDAEVAIAKAAGRPQISATVGLNKDLSRSGILETQGSGPTVSAGLDVSYPLFNGGAVRNSVRAAETRVEAGRATLTAVEGDVFTNAVSAYMDVIRDRAIVELNQNNVKVLQTNLEATRDRFQIGDLTRTDVAQSEARLQLGYAQLSTSQGNETASEATYRQVVGHPPGNLAPPPPLPPLPTTADEAVRIALASNPDLVSISRESIAAGYDVRVAAASRLPTLSAVGSGTYVNEIGGHVAGVPSTGGQTTVGLSANIPIFQGGLPAARIRQAQAVQGQVFEQVVGTERAVVQQTRAAFAVQSVGTRTIIEVLNAEQDLLNSQVALVTAKRDAYVAGFQLLNAMGQAQAQDLGLDGGPLYDPLGNYRHVANNWNDWATDPTHVPVATRTVSPQEMPANPIVTPQIEPARINSTPPTAPGVTTTPGMTTTTPAPQPTGNERG
jgi:outer membrane protein